MIGLIDYGMGNIHSLMSAGEYLGIKIKICKNKSDLQSVDKIILPGVGAFGACMDILKSLGFYDELNYQVINNKKDILGICLGMQIMATKSLEFGETKGLNWISGTVEQMNVGDNFKLPHVGWNSLNHLRQSPLFSNLNLDSDYYFVHSYSFKNSYQNDILATFNYSSDYTASINKGNIYGVQFHPEKSQENGLRILENFVNL